MSAERCTLRDGEKKHVAPGDVASEGQCCPLTPYTIMRVKSVESVLARPLLKAGNMRPGLPCTTLASGPPS